MAEPKEQASRLLPVIDRVVRWSVRESRIGGAAGEAYAVLGKEGEQVLIDPLPLSAAALERLRKRGKVSAIILTIQSHQRSAWRYAKKFGAPVLAPEGAVGLDEEPDHSYHAGERLAVGLMATALPGPAFSAHGLSWRTEDGSVLFCGDLVTSSKEGLRFVPDEYMDAPGQARESVRGLLGRRIDVLCPGHGAPLIGGVRRALLHLLATDMPRSAAG
jgi:glyoxylase-like metal-dependent hydrolase (beta-lactamase superfamily II)